ncbi:hypothetical protein KDW_57970 [Dictyobacter vulcani]|uniref:Uncharacterized protein n=1 Tax=Dictyobacter vulcani TaxID=2607529 RepID=A0A5J4KUN7_9CHLR|nr:hypothetical protein [Dictyobacter vulcani]GER91635.1 hypothetical protein KDW_57970 [Dictyobacter vulcani]
MSQDGKYQESELVCPICAQNIFKQSHSLLSSRTKTYLGLDWTNPTADMHICFNCLHILWFLDKAIGMQGESLVWQDEQPLICPLCQEEKLISRETLLSDKATTMFNTDWGNPAALNYICTSCGFMQWFLNAADGEGGETVTVADHELHCTRCNHAHFERSTTLLSSRSATLLHLDWTSPEADTYTCTRCGNIEWFQQG